jgi:predicted ATPase
MASSSLIGRDVEVTELAKRAMSHRLVTVVGPGGVGKTALTRAAVEQLASQYALWGRVVDLTRVDDPAAVPGTIANHLGFDSFDALLSPPNDRPVLLVIDNCEHLLDAVAAAVMQVLGSCNQPTVIATSRAPLEVPGESIVALAPLAVPKGDDDPASCPSVQLLLERCRDAGANLTAEDLPAVIDLCRRLDGLPLAIEIAAARTRTMGVAEIAARLTESVDVLERPRFRGDPRHRSVADTIRWSYGLLTRRQAELLERLGVFAGPFTSARARSIVNADEATTVDADLDELVNVSLVVVDASGPETRYRLLDTVRRFALDQLRRRNELEPAYDRFVDHVVDTVQRTVSGASSAWRPNIVNELVASFDDIAEALRWCIAHDADPKRAYRLCAVLWAVVHQGHADDIADITRRTLDRWPDDGSQAAVQVAAVRATAEYVTGHPDRAVEIATATMVRLTEPGRSSVIVHRVLGQARRALDDLPGSVEAFRSGAAIARAYGMTAMALELEIAAALVAADEGNVDQGIAELQGVIEEALAIDSVTTLAWGRAVLGWVMLRHDVVAARHVIDQALAEARRIDYPVAVAVGLRSRSFAELIAGDTVAAVASATELMRDLLRRGALSNGRLLLDVTAAIAHRAQHSNWQQVLATARSLPITTLVSARFELLPLPAGSVPPVPRLEAIGLAWNVLADMAATADQAGRDDGVGDEQRIEQDGEQDGERRTVGTTAVGEACIRRLGDVSEFTFAGRSVTLRTTKGVDDLVRLIEAAGREIHCLDLVGVVVDEASTGEVIDAEARRNYEQRIRDLQAEIEEAENNSDYARAYRHQAELDSLIDHLAASLGHGNRTRRAPGSAERARSAVTHRLRTTIRQVGKAHGSLGRHLTHAVNTGTYCSYRPEQPIVWRIE